MLSVDFLCKETVLNILSPDIRNDCCFYLEYLLGELRRRGGGLLMERIERSDELLIHSISTAGLSYLAGKRLELNKDRSFTMCAGAYLHDVGKSDIPDEILYKCGALTESEYAEVKRHTHIGAARIQSSDLVDEIKYVCTCTALFHHETRNNYARDCKLEDSVALNVPGKAGDCDEFTRMCIDVVACADTLSAMCDKRSYKPASPEKFSKAIEELKGAYPHVEKLFQRSERSA